jgi:hypothetical protein
MKRSLRVQLSLGRSAGQIGRKSLSGKRRGSKTAEIYNCIEWRGFKGRIRGYKVIKS